MESDVGGFGEGIGGWVSLSFLGWGVLGVGSRVARDTHPLSDTIRKRSSKTDLGRDSGRLEGVEAQIQQGAHSAFFVHSDS